METVVRPPEAFGDNWSDGLERGDLDKLSDYFRSCTAAAPSTSP
jgi:hypothetical protein